MAGHVKLKGNMQLALKGFGVWSKSAGPALVKAVLGGGAKL